MKSFQQFITEAYDKEMAGQASRAPGEGGRIRASRKKRDLDKTRTKAVGGGKTAPVKDYKPRKDIGTNKPRSRTQQQPEKPRGSAALSPREAQKKAAMERRAAKHLVLKLKQQMSYYLRRRKLYLLSINQ